ncbi:uncharacterized protein L3040_003334 [Drepanopeziza brunnea f. sp. 'multigermtubi']|uniref:uncharacterized protein n=1 Tax=Drepanopeziza brunnea f. sp. 'multigermtubi' TaxID=698441 RepID=UPI002399E193|nr:hypothetical protein L3040_003334 [Drepanopeziza brunnea f. sp. 'multigermtubi']
MSPPTQPADIPSHQDDALPAVPAVPASGLMGETGGGAEEAHKASSERGNSLVSNGGNGGNVYLVPDTKDDNDTQDLSAPSAVWSSGQEVGGDKEPGAEEDVPKTVETAASKGKKVALDHDPMESSTATLKPKAPSAKPFPEQHLSPIDMPYNDPTPKTPYSSQPPSRSTSNATSTPQYSRNLDVEARERSPTRSDAGFDEKASASGDERESSRSEIQTIMNQFSEEGQGLGHEEIMSPRFEIAGPLLGSPVQHPPRESSLEPLNATFTSAGHSMQDLPISTGSPGKQQTRDPEDIGPTVPPKPDSIRSLRQSRASDDRYQHVDPLPPPALHRPPPPEPEPEPDLPFDFHRFLEQLRHRTADPVAKFLRSFLQEFGKKQWMVHEQCDVWREVSDAEFDNAREGMEKLVMNRLYTQTFSPAIPPPQPIPGSKSKRRGGERPMGPGRKGQHQEDVERDEILAQKVLIYGWIKEQHLDIPAVGDSGKRFLILAQQELLKIKTYRAPRDKIICVLNCCKVIFGLLKHSKSDSSADSFMPLLIYVVLQANPEHMVSNVQYILRFRNQDKLAGEAGYYLSSLLGAVQFIENLDRTSLTISDEEFEKNVEAAVSAIAEKHQAQEVVEPPPPTQLSEKSTLSRPQVTPRHSMDGESSNLRMSNEYESGDGGLDEKSPMSGLLSTIQRPLTSIGRIFSEEAGPSHSQSGPARTPLPGNTPRMTPAPQISSDAPQGLPRPPTTQDNSQRSRRTAEDAAARQASAEAAEAHRIQRAEHANVVETLAGMFPDLDREIISDVVTQKEGRVGLAVDACLALSS